LPKPEGDGSGDAYGGKEGVSAAVVAHGDTPPVLDPAESVLDAMALAVQDLVIGDRELAALDGRDARRDASLQQAGTEGIAVLATVCEQFLGGRQKWQQQSSTLVVAHLTFGQ
jgi:hypothetical protein